mgnify:CR=1 FL=1
MRRKVPGVFDDDSVPYVLLSSRGYQRAAAVGLLMAVGGYVLGMYAAFGCAWLIAWVAG